MKFTHMHYHVTRCGISENRTKVPKYIRPLSQATVPWFPHFFYNGFKKVTIQPTKRVAWLTPGRKPPQVSLHSSPHIRWRAGLLTLSPAQRPHPRYSGSRAHLPLPSPWPGRFCVHLHPLPRPTPRPHAGGSVPPRPHSTAFLHLSRLILRDSSGGASVKREPNAHVPHTSTTTTHFQTSWQIPTDPGRGIMDEKRTESGAVKSAKAAANRILTASALHLQTQKTAGAAHIADTAISDTTDTATPDTDGGLAGSVAMVVINKGEADVGLTLPGYRNSTGGANVESDFEEKGSSGDPGGNNKKDQVRPYSRSKCAQS